jgi:cohesin complex subunit SA-1/2
MGFWFKKYPGHFLDGAYLRYVGWVLSDSSTQVRLEAVKSLSNVYQQSEYIVSLNHFTERFKPRLIEMAIGDTELAVRVAVIQVLGAIDEQSLLEEDEREKMCLLVFDEEAKVRKAVGRFVKGVWDEGVEERLTVKKKPSEKDKERTGIKVFGSLLVKWGKALDKAAADSRADGDGADKESLSSGEGSSRVRNPQVVSLMGSTQKGRTALAVEALWNEVDPVSDWESLLDVLLLDHSAGGEEGTGGSRGRKGHTKQAAEGSVVEDVWRLEEEEESLLLEALLATLTRARAEVVGAKKVGAVKPVSLMSTDRIILVSGRRGISHI